MSADGIIEGGELYAVIVEHSDDGGRTWQVADIDWTVGQAAMLAREIPWAVRFRRVRLADDGLVPQAEAKAALAQAEKLEEIFESGEANENN